MVKCCIIYYSIDSHGVRALMAYLQEHTNAEIKLLLFPFTNLIPRGKFSDHIVEQVVQECRGFDIVGFSVPSDHYMRTVQLSEALKNKTDVKVIYGGTHPTIRPQQCLKYADAVCVGEGEEAMTELINHYDRERVIASDISNIYVKDKSGNIISNDPRPPIDNLDKVPIFHFWETEERIFHNGYFRDATIKLYKRYMVPHYVTLASRGCAFACTYCGSNSLKRVYKGQKILRWRSWDSFFTELHHVKSALPFIKSICLTDDLFMATKLEDMKTFCNRYKKEINIPLVVVGIHPSLVTEEKVKLLVNAGAILLVMGIQSGCQKTLDLYKRQTKVKDIIESADLLHKHSKGISIAYDFIADNPFETNEDMQETLRFINKLQKPFELHLYSLTLYPGTSLHDKAIEEGLMSPDEVFEGGFTSLGPGYYNDLLRIIKNLNVPNKILDVLIERKQGYRIWHKLLSFLAHIQALLTAGIRDISRGDFRRIHQVITDPRNRNYRY